MVHPSSATFKARRILAIDDSKTKLVHLTNLFKSEGYEVEAADRSREALVRLEREDYDCVLVNLMMPDMDGMEVCRHITSMCDRIDSLVAVLMLTEREGKEDLTRGWKREQTTSWAS